LVKELIIDSTPEKGVTIALLQDKQLVELNKEQANNNFAVGDIYLGRIKKIMPGLNAAFVKAGQSFQQAYTNQQDTTLATVYNANAMHSFESALELNPASLDAKTGLGAAMVTGTNNPMAGIAILREVIAADPKNIEANKTLGLFSMQSRQFDKAIDRFKTVIELKPDAESYFYLATSYENIGMKNQAIVAFQKSKELAADPSLSQFIDRRVEELSK